MIIPEKTRESLGEFDATADCSSTKLKVLRIASKAGFENVAKLEEKWQGNDVYYPCGPRGETLYIGPVYFVVTDGEIVPYTGTKARKIIEDIETQYLEETEN